jgi:hypothetical protein
VAEEAKKSEQASKFWETQKAREGKTSWMRVLNPYRWFKANPVTVKVDELPSALILPMQKSLVTGYADNKINNNGNKTASKSLRTGTAENDNDPRTAGDPSQSSGFVSKF